MLIEFLINPVNFLWVKNLTTDKKAKSFKMLDLLFCETMIFLYYNISYLRRVTALRKLLKL
jgi:hypothetical protein